MYEALKWSVTQVILGRLDVEIRDLSFLVPTYCFFEKKCENKTCEQEKSGRTAAGVGVRDPQPIKTGEPL